MMRSGEGGLCETADEYFIISPGQFQQPPCGRSHMDILGVRMDSGEGEFAMTMTMTMTMMTNTMTNEMALMTSTCGLVTMVRFGG